MAGATLVQRAQGISMRSREEGINLLNRIVEVEEEIEDEDTIRAKEQGILHLGELYREEGKAAELAELIKAARPFLKRISKAKAAKLVRTLLDYFLELDSDIGIEVQLCKECIVWAKEERRVFLRQSLEVRLIGLYFDTRMFTEALALSTTLLKELKKLDDKNLLVELLLLESKTYHAVGNLPRARAALTSARTTANAIYCPPKLQAALDFQSGILHAADERDFKTAYSYFYEAFQSYDSVDCPKAITALKYMLLSKIMLNTPDDVQNIMNSKLAVKYSGSDIDAMKCIAQASQKRSLADFEQTLKNFKIELEDDDIVRAHLGALYDNMLEQNLIGIIEPYSRVQIAHVAQSIRLPNKSVENKLSQMVLDKKVHGVLNQREGILIVYEEVSVDKTYETAIKIIHSMGKVVDTLYQKAKKLS